MLVFHKSISEGYSHFTFLRQKGTSTILSIRDGRVDLLRIYTKSDASKSITAHPQMAHKVAENLRWFEWDRRLGLLYILTQNMKVPGQYDFVVFAFPEKRPSRIYKTTLELDIALNPTSLYAKDLFKVQRFGDMHDNAFCLCQQHSREKEGGIDVTVYILHHGMKMSYTIPCSSPELDKSQVVFDRIDDLLMIYLPGYFIHLLDCSIDHPPVISLKLHGEEYANLLGHQKKGEAIELQPYIFLSERKDITNVLMTQSGRILYEYRLEASCIDRILAIGDPALDLQALLLSLLHFKDTELSFYVIRTICTLRPTFVSAELFKQFLIGTLHNDFVMSLKNEILPRKLSNFMPLYTKSYPLETLLKTGCPVDNVAVAEMDTCPDRPKRRDRFYFSSIDWRKVDKDRTTQTSSFRKFLSSTVGKFIGGSDMQTSELDQDNDCNDPYRNALINAYIEYIFEPLSKEVKVNKSGLSLASELRNMQSHLSGVLYESITDATAEAPLKTQFLVLSHYHCAIEELMYPTPWKFPKHFAELGYQALPRNMFMQYLERNVFFITKDFVATAMYQLKKTPEDISFANFLLSYLTQREALDLVHRNHFDDDYVVENILMNETDKASKIDMDNLVNPEFLPLAMYIESLKGREDIQEEQVKFIEDVSKHKFMAMLKSTKM